MKSAEQKAKKVPTIRFAGFDDAWVEKKLGEMASFSKGMGYSKGDLKENGTPIVLYGRLYTKYETIISDVDTFADAKSNSVYSKGGEVIVPGSGETAEDISIASVVKKSGVLLGGDLNVITPPKNLDSVFLAISISNGKPHSDMAKMAQGKSVVHLHNTDLAEINLPYPNIIEQQKIGSFFSNIDSLISLEQKKYDKLTQVKKSMLEKMFPKEGATVPEIRFSGFTGKWRKVKIETIASFTRGNGLSWKDIVNNGKYECILYGHLYTDYGMIADSIKYKTNTIPLNAAYSRFGDVLIPGSDTTPTGLARATSIEKDDVLLGGDINVIRPHENINGNFLSLAINVNRNELIKLIKGTTVRHIHNSDIKDIELCVPSVMKEQEMLGNYFKNLDSLISLQQRKLEKLKNIKKSLLEKMFV